MSKTSPHKRGGAGGGSARPCVSVPQALLSAYHAAGLPPLSTLLQEAMREALRRVGVEPPAAVTPPRTAVATAARWGRLAR